MSHERRIEATPDKRGPSTPSPLPSTCIARETLTLVDVSTDVSLFDSDNVVDYHDSDIGVGGVMAYTGKVTSAESLGRILQQARLLSGLSQRQLARRLGTTQKYVWELEAGKPSIVMDRLFAAMRETGMELTATITVRDEHG